MYDAHALYTAMVLPLPGLSCLPLLRLVDPKLPTSDLALQVIFDEY